MWKAPLFLVIIDFFCVFIFNLLAFQKMEMIMLQ